jgi:hypothetical protein
MATTTYLSQPHSLTIAGQDLTDQASSISLTLGSNPLTSTAFGDLGERMVPGLANCRRNNHSLRFIRRDRS